MPGHLAGLVVNRATGIGAAVLMNTSAGGEPEKLALDLAVAAIEALPEAAKPWQPGEPPPAEIEPILGRWWTEGEEVVLVLARPARGEADRRHAGPRPLRLRARRRGVPLRRGPGAGRAAPDRAGRERRGREALLRDVSASPRTLHVLGPRAQERQDGLHECLSRRVSCARGKKRPRPQRRRGAVSPVGPARPARPGSRRTATRASPRRRPERRRSGAGRSRREVRRGIPSWWRGTRAVAHLPRVAPAGARAPRRRRNHASTTHRRAPERRRPARSARAPSGPSAPPGARRRWLGSQRGRFASATGRCRRRSRRSSAACERCRGSEARRRTRRSGP